MEKQGYVFNGLIFLVFVPVLVLAVYYSNNVSEIASSDYQEILAMKVYYISTNLYIILNQSADDFLDFPAHGNKCNQIIQDLERYIGITNDPTSGPPVKIVDPTSTGSLHCQGGPGLPEGRVVKHLNVSLREDNPNVWICRGCS